MNTQPKKLVVDKQNPLTVNSLKALGFKVSVLHFRRVRDTVVLKGIPCALDISYPMPLFEIQRRGICNAILAKGGYTTARVSLPATREFVIGESKCHEECDVYCKKTGIMKALFDAVSKMKKSGMLAKDDEVPPPIPPTS